MTTVIQGPALQLPWWDSQLFGDTVIALFIAVGHYLTNITLKRVGSVVQDTHTLVNSQMGTALRTNVASAQALYEVTKLPEHLKLLTDAKAMLENHNQKQSLVDARVTS
jgi:hypothetical protein